jgi:hypothetical protein
MNSIFATLCLATALSFAASAADSPVQATPAAASLDTRPVFMLVVTNQVLQTNVVIVTNYVVVTNITFTTNFYNAQGQLLQPVQPTNSPIPGLTPVASPKPPTPDPDVTKASQLQALKDLLATSVAAASNKLCVAGSFTNTATNAIQIPEGITILDLKKGQRLNAAMNAAAERAAPLTMTAIQEAITRLKPDDPAQFLQGANAAATRLLISAEGQNISNQVLPIVQRAAAAAQVPAAYSSVMLTGGGLFGALLGAGQNVDINTHITKSLLDVIFKSVAAQENAIRTRSAESKTNSLQNAFH